MAATRIHERCWAPGQRGTRAAAALRSDCRRACVNNIKGMQGHRSAAAPAERVRANLHNPHSSAQSECTGYGVFYTLRLAIGQCRCGWCVLAASVAVAAATGAAGSYYSSRRQQLVGAFSPPTRAQQRRAAPRCSVGALHTHLHCVLLPPRAGRRGCSVVGNSSECTLLLHESSWASAWACLASTCRHGGYRRASRGLCGCCHHLRRSRAAVCWRVGAACPQAPQRW